MTRACTSCSAPSDTRRRRNHDPKTIGEPCAGEPLARIERGMGKRARSSGAAPLTTNDDRSAPRGGRPAPPRGTALLLQTPRARGDRGRRREALLDPGDPEGPKGSGPELRIPEPGHPGAGGSGPPDRDG